MSNRDCTVPFPVFLPHSVMLCLPCALPCVESGSGGGWGMCLPVHVDPRPRISHVIVEHHVKSSACDRMLLSIKIALSLS